MILAVFLSNIIHASAQPADDFPTNSDYVFVKASRSDDSLKGAALVAWDINDLYGYLVLTIKTENAINKKVILTFLPSSTSCKYDFRNEECVDGKVVRSTINTANITNVHFEINKENKTIVILVQNETKEEFAYVLDIRSMQNLENVQSLGVKDIYDKTRYKDAPHPFKSIAIVYATSIWPEKEYRGSFQYLKDTDFASLRSTLKKMPSEIPIILDIESHDSELFPTLKRVSWNLDIRKFTTELVKMSIQRDNLISLIEVVREEKPDNAVSIYGMCPIRDYWTIVRNEPNALQKWHEANEFQKPVCEKLDFVTPSLYLFYENMPDDIIPYVQGMVSEARMYEKKVIPFIMPRFHPAGTFSDPDRWIPEKQVKVYITEVLKNADGLIVWDAASPRWNFNFSNSVGYNRDWYDSIRELIDNK